MKNNSNFIIILICLNTSRRAWDPVLHKIISASAERKYTFTFFFPSLSSLSLPSELSPPFPWLSRVSLCPSQSSNAIASSSLWIPSMRSGFSYFACLQVQLLRFDRTLNSLLCMHLRTRSVFLSLINAACFSFIFIYTVLRSLCLNLLSQISIFSFCGSGTEKKQIAFHVILLKFLWNLNHLVRH